MNTLLTIPEERTRTPRRHETTKPPALPSLPASLLRINQRHHSLRTRLGTHHRRQ